MTKSEQKSFVLVDGSSYLFRAYYALPPLTNSQGQPTGAVYGVLNMLKRLLKDHAPEHIAVVFDAKGKTFRHDLYADYKANRAVMPEELASQIPLLHDAIRAMGFPLVIESGVEADDVIGTLAQQAEQQGFQTIISTGDKDIAQLVTDNTTLVNTMKDEILDIAGVKNKFGVAPERIVDYLALIGDTVDNIPGVPKVGPKTANKWLEAYGSLAGVIEHADDIKGKVGENLRATIPDFPLLRKLVTIKTDVSLTLSPNELVLTDTDKAALSQLFAQLEFKSWLAELENQSQSGTADSTATDDAAIDYTVILDQKTFDDWVELLQKTDVIAFDTETTGLDPMQAELVGVSFAVAPGQAAYLPLRHDYEGAPNQLARDQVLPVLSELLTNSEKTIVGQNLKYDWKVLKRYGVTINAPCWDTMLAAYTLKSSGMRYDLGSLAEYYLNRSVIEFEDVAGKGAKQLTFNQIAIEQAAPYAAEDADIALQLYQVLLPKLQAEGKLWDAFHAVEMPVMRVLAEMEFVGVAIDVDLLQAQSRDLTARLADIEQEIYTLAGEEFNINSPKQLQTLLYDKLQLPVLKKTPKGQPSTAEPVLQQLSHDYPLPALILSFRSLSKLKTTYTDKLPEQINPTTGHIHTSYHQAVTATGRLSSSDPNLQNIPARSEEGRKIRQSFVAREGYAIVAADYSQIELRIMAHLSQDPGLLAAFEQEQDVHASTASEVFGVSLAAVTPDQRRHAKAINFGLMYGMSSYGLSQQLGMDTKQAQDYINVYFDRYPKVKQYMEQAREIAAEQGYVETLLGRRVWVPDINAKHAVRRKAAERAAINAPLQGSAADIIKLAMICVADLLAQQGIDATLLMQVHDELVFEVKRVDIDALRQDIRHCMEHAVELSVPLLVDIGVGDNWDQAH